MKILKVRKQKTIPWTTKLPIELKDDMALASAVTDRSISSFMRVAIKEKIERLIEEDPKLKGKFKSLIA